MLNFLKSLLTIILIITITGCATNRKSGWDQRSETIKMSKKDIEALKKSADKAWSQRHIKKSLEQALGDYETLSKTASTQAEYYDYAVTLCRGYYFLADSHYKDIETKKSYWNVGTSWGEKAMATNEDFRKHVSSGEDLTDGLKYLDKSYTGAIYWTAVNLGKWAKSSGIATILKYKNRIRTMVGLVEKMDETYFYAAAHRYWGAYYAVAPGFAGGDIDKSKTHFEKSIALAPKYLGTNVLFAEFHDTKKGNKEDFKMRLKKVLSANSKADPNIEPENIIEQAKAKEMLTKMDELF